ncbi:HEPN domain-containing protein [Clostridium beijerinckii]|uniref:RiboL-PSP-HEPN domain-containing protein n=1 Tax=Clostridium beijerinckii TaxID=1520 RepID=A0AAX0AX14_CLOBE|nr:HEPN domain-containing protein [Clostridium beijerinckii]NRT87282.1 hypothetical protein [Clostridium beijerinckii]NYC72713.1 hypothetical protein [Clostridium beijerinckii]
MILNLKKTPLQLFSRRLADINKYIQSIQNDLDRLNMLEETRKLESKKHYLNQTYIIHLVSHWQAFIEQLVEYGFSKILIKSDESICEKEIKRFNTPNLANVDKIFENVLGIKSISNNYQWDDMTRNKAAQILDEVLKLRHRIAHTGFSKMKLDINKNYKYMEHLYNLAYILQYTVDKEICGDLKKFEIPYSDKKI